MSVESWARRASGLLVPTLGFANHPLGRFQPCVGPCCGCESCGVSLAPGVWADITGVLNGTCSDCEDLNTTWNVGDVTSACEAYTDVGDLCSFYWLFVQYVVVDGQCCLDVLLYRWFENPYWCYRYVRWRKVLSGYADPLDHTVPYYEDDMDCGPGTDPVCEFRWSSVHVYQS